MFYLHKANLGLIATIIIYLGLAFAYSLTTPPFQALDEQSHFAFARQWMEEGPLPVIEEGKWASPEAHQPPVYYALSAAVGSVAKSLNIAGITEYSEAAVSFYLSRWLSILGGLVTILATYKLTCLVIPRRWSLFPVALVALNPTFLTQNSVVTNDGLVATFTTLTLLGAVSIASSRSLSKRTFFLTGLALGLGALTKLSAMIMVVPLIIAIAILARRVNSWKVFLKGSLITFMAAFAVVGWWYIRNWLLYNDPLAWGLNASLNPKLVLERGPTLAQYPGELLSLAETYWAAFGYIANVRIAPPIYLALFSVCALAALGLVIFVARRKRMPDIDWPMKAGFLLLLLAFLVNLASVFRYAQSYGGAWHGRHLLPSIAAVAILMVLGLSQIVPRKRQAFLSGVISGLFVLAVLVLPFYIAPLRITPSALSADEVGSIEHPLDVVYDNGARLLGYSLDNHRVKPGEKLGVTLYWEAIGGMSTDWTISVQLLDTNQKLFGQVDSRPLSGNYLTLFWKKGEVWKERYEVPVSAQAHGAPFHLLVSFYELTTMRHASVVSKSIPVADNGANFGEIKVVGSEAEPKPQYPRRVDFQDNIRFLGWDSAQNIITLYWEARGTPNGSYTIFAHLLDDQRRVVAQNDSIPAKGNFPTNTWEDGDVIKDEHSITAPPGRYLLEIGLYDPKTNKRLMNAQGEEQIILGEITWPSK